MLDKEKRSSKEKAAEGQGCQVKARQQEAASKVRGKARCRGKSKKLELIGR